MNYPGHEEDASGDEYLLRNGDIKQIKERLNAYGRRTGITQRATQAWSQNVWPRRPSGQQRREGNP